MFPLSTPHTPTQKDSRQQRFYLTGIVYWLKLLCFNLQIDLKGVFYLCSVFWIEGTYSSSLVPSGYHSIWRLPLSSLGITVTTISSNTTTIAPLQIQVSTPNSGVKHILVSFSSSSSSGISFTNWSLIELPPSLLLTPSLPSSFASFSLRLHRLMTSKSVGNHRCFGAMSHTPRQLPLWSSAAVWVPLVDREWGRHSGTQAVVFSVPGAVATQVLLLLPTALSDCVYQSPTPQSTPPIPLPLVTAHTHTLYSAIVCPSKRSVLLFTVNTHTLLFSRKRKITLDWAMSARLGSARFGSPSALNVLLDHCSSSLSFYLSNLSPSNDRIICLYSLHYWCVNLATPFSLLLLSAAKPHAVIYLPRSSFCRTVAAAFGIWIIITSQLQ